MRQLSFVRTRAWHEWKIKQLAFREYAHIENLRRYNRQRGYIINPYSYGAGGGGDPYFSSVVALLHFDDGGTAFTDVTGKTWSAIGSGPTSSTAQSKFGGASLLNTNNYGIQTADHTDFVLGSGDFTVEVWTRLSQYNSPDGNNGWVVAKGGGSSVPGWGILAHAASGGMRMLGSTDNASFGFDVPAISASQNVWYHWELDRSGNSWYAFKDGVQEGSTGTLSGTVNTTSDGVALMNIYGYDNHTFPAQGYIDDVRVTKGVARHTSNFTAPTAAHPDS